MQSDTSTQPPTCTFAPSSPFPHVVLVSVPYPAAQRQEGDAAVEQRNVSAISGEVHNKMNGKNYGMDGWTTWDW